MNTDHREIEIDTENAEDADFEWWMLPVLAGLALVAINIVLAVIYFFTATSDPCRVRCQMKYRYEYLLPLPAAACHLGAWIGKPIRAEDRWNCP